MKLNIIGDKKDKKVKIDAYWSDESKQKKKQDTIIIKPEKFEFL